MAESSRNAFATVKEGLDIRQYYARKRPTYIEVTYVGGFVQTV